MENMRKIILTALLYLSLSVLLFTGLQGIFGFISEKELLGVVTVTEKCSPTADSIFSGKFQQCATAYVSNHAGFRPTLIRIDNQLTFSIFRISPEKNIVLGKDDYLFEMNYINSYLGRDYIGRSRMVEKIRRLEKFQQTLREHNVDFILVFTPSKSRVMPEFMPRKFQSTGQPTNYEVYLDVLSKEGKKINFLDLNRYYLLMRDTALFPLYPKGGTHWTNFSARHWALDTLLRYMEKVRGVKIPRLIPEEVTWTTELQDPDEDIAGLFNLFFRFPSGKMPYQAVRADSSGAVKPRVLAIADSYFWELYGWGQLPHVFRSIDFWVWNNVRYPKEKYKDHPESDYLWYKQDILDHDFVLLMATEPNLPTLLEFDEKTYLMFDPQNPVLLALQKKRLERIGFYKTLIRNDKKWSDLVREKAQIRKITFEEMIQRDAEYMVDREINTMKTN